MNKCQDQCQPCCQEFENWDRTLGSAWKSSHLGVANILSHSACDHVSVDEQIKNLLTKCLTENGHKQYAWSIQGTPTKETRKSRTKLQLGCLQALTQLL